VATGAANPYRAYDLYTGVGFRRLAAFGRYRRACAAGGVSRRAART
jgi:hypothetical protein